MRRFVLFFVLIVASLSAQQRHEVIVRNIEVPLRVLDGNIFVDNLTIDEIELFEDGEPQEIKAFYLLKDAKIERQEAERDYMPILSRSFYFVFQLTEYDPKIKDGLDYFFTNVYLPGDKVDILTTYKEYSLSSQALQDYSKDVVVEYIQDVIRKNTQITATEYNQLLRDLTRIASSISYRTGGANNMESGGADLGASIEASLQRYSEALQKMENLRMMDERRFLRFASQMKKLSGQKYVFFFYQREFRPELRPQSMNFLMEIFDDRPNVIGALQDVFVFYSKETKLNAERIERAFADSSILFNFVYIAKSPKLSPGILMRELSGNAKDLFSDIAHATGGIADDSPNSFAAIQNAAEITNKCYLLYYSPNKYIQDGEFRQIEVRVKNSKYKIIHRKGYFAD